MSSSALNYDLMAPHLRLNERLQHPAVAGLLTTIWHDWSNAAECYDTLHVGAWVPCNAYSNIIESAISIVLKEKGVLLEDV